MVKIVYPNEEEILNNNFNNQIVHSVFLAGTIDNGNSKNWQKEVIEEFRNINLPYNLDIYNPRVKEWNPNSTTKNIYKLKDDDLAIFRRREVGLVYQFYNLKIPLDDHLNHIDLKKL